MSKSIKSKIVSGVFWLGLEQTGAYCIRFILSVVLARRLMPEEYGIIAIMTVFITLSNVFINSGFSAALIQKKDMKDVDCCSVFYINIAIAFIMYGILYLVAPFIAAFYEIKELSLYLHVFSLTFIFGAFSLVQSVLLKKRMLFHLSFRISWIALIVSGAVGIAMAYTGYGVWALIAQQLTNAIVIAVMEWYLVRWRPQWLFDWKRTKEMLHFSWKMFCSGILDTLYNNVYSLVIGKIADLKMLSYYDRGKQYPKLGMDIINTTIGTVLFPAFSEIQDDRQQMKDIVNRGLKLTFYSVAPVLAFLFLFSDSITILLLTEKWLPSVIFIRLCCIIFFFWPYHTINLQILTACGQSDFFLYLEILKKIQAVIVLAITFRFGVVTMVSASAVISFIEVFENGWFSRKLIGYAPWQQLFDTFPIILFALFASTISYFATRFIHIICLKLIIGIIILSAFYLTTTIVTHVFPREIEQILTKKLLGT